MESNELGRNHLIPLETDIGIDIEIEIEIDY